MASRLNTISGTHECRAATERSARRHTPYTRTYPKDYAYALAASAVMLRVRQGCDAPRPYATTGAVGEAAGQAAGLVARRLPFGRAHGGRRLLPPSGRAYSRNADAQRACIAAPR